MATSSRQLLSVCALTVGLAATACRQAPPAAAPVNRTATKPVQAAQAFAGPWWKSASPDEKLGFLYATDDCLTFDVQPALSFSGTWDSYIATVDAFYKNSPELASKTVREVFATQGHAATSAAMKDPRYGDEFWRSHNETVRRGFVEGYLDCRYGPPAAAHPWPIDLYVTHLDDLYNVDDRHGEDAPEYSGSVASALERERPPATTRP